MEYSYKDFVEQFYLKDFYKYYVAEKTGITKIEDMANYEFMSLETYMKEYGPIPGQADYDLHYRATASRWAKLNSMGALPLCNTQENVSKQQIDEFKANSVMMNSSAVSIFKGYDVFVDIDKNVYLGKPENYENGIYLNSDDSLIFVSDKDIFFRYFSSSGWMMKKEDFFSKYGGKEIWEEFVSLKDELTNKGLELSDTGEALMLWENDFDSWAATFFEERTAVVGDVSKEYGSDSVPKQRAADDMMSLVTDVVSKNDIAGFSPDLEVETDFDK